MPLTDENLRFLQSLAEAGAAPFHTMDPATCREAFDGLLGFTTVLPQSREMLEEAVTWLRACFAKAG